MKTTVILIALAVCVLQAQGPESDRRIPAMVQGCETKSMTTEARGTILSARSNGWKKSTKKVCFTWKWNGKDFDAIRDGVVETINAPMCLGTRMVFTTPVGSGVVSYDGYVHDGIITKGSFSRTTGGEGWGKVTIGEWSGTFTY